MIRADARQKEQKLFDATCKLKHLAFDDITYEQAVKLRQELEQIRQRQQFYKNIIRLCDYANKEVNDEYRTFAR